MAEKVKTAWLNDEQGAKFAPKTLVESIQDAEGTSLNDRLASAGMSAEVEGERLILGVSGGAGGGIHRYSTEEKVIGEWIDGKPIYEVTVHEDGVFYGDKDNIFPNSYNPDVDKLISLTGFCFNNSNCLQLPYLHSVIGGIIAIHYAIKNKSFNLRSGSWYNSSNPLTDMYITIQYTKTTD